MVVAREKIRRLPGFRFETQTPPLDETLPRMDISVFVGFSQSGPIGIPVAIESATQFTSLFGEDAPLAWDKKGGEVVHSYLGPAVRSFFRNGGKRCWVLRVAKTKAGGKSHLNRARYNRFPVSGLALATFDAETGRIKKLSPALARARSEGSWSDSLLVGSSLLSRSVQSLGFRQLDDRNVVADFALETQDDIAAGELFRLTFKGNGVDKENQILFFVADSIEPLLTSPLSELNEASSRKKGVRVKSARAVWLEEFSPVASSPPGTRIQASVWTREVEASPLANAEKEIFERQYEARFLIEPNARSADETQKIKLELLNIRLKDAPGPGSIVIVEAQKANADYILFAVESIGVSDIGSSAEGSAIQLTGSAFQVLKNPPAFAFSGPSLPLSVSLVSCERLSFELMARKASDFSANIADLAFNHPHERFWGYLPTDEQLFKEAEASETEIPSITLWRQVGDFFRFPLAGYGKDGGIFFPVSMSSTPINFLGPIDLNGTKLERDGLADFDASLFLDEKLSPIGVNNLMVEAEFIRYVSPQPRRLTGVHAALEIEEATIIAVPDAMHRGWHLVEDDKTPPAFAGSKTDEKNEQKSTDFSKCDVGTLNAPELETGEPFSEDGSYTLSWTTSETEGQFILEEFSSTEANDKTTIYAGPQRSFSIYGHKAGNYFYRVKVTQGEKESDWSNILGVRVGAARRWELRETKDYKPDTLLSVQRAMLRMCAARGDIFAVLSIPEHYREDDSISHIKAIRSFSNLIQNNGSDSELKVSPLSFGEANALTFGAIYHPWFIVRELDQANGFKSIPPCGAACGVVANRALTRGAWIAPANETLRDVVSMTPKISASRRLDLQDAQLNLIRQEPRGFFALSADTLSMDEDLRPVGVRRLLILLKRLALKHGTRYVFEPNNDAFRRSVERGFSRLLDQMFVRGAFAGKTAATSYQVVISETLNNFQAMHEGKFIVELKVAPSLPMKFLTIRLVQTGGRGFVTEKI